MNFIRTVEPEAEPLSLAEVKDHLRVSGIHDDGLISGLIAAARQMAESHTGRPLINQTWKVYLDKFPANGVIELKPSVVSITSIKYTDTDGAEQTLAASEYELDTSRTVNLIRLAYDKSWPSTLSHPQSVYCEFVAGYGADNKAVPQAIKQGMLLVIGHLYEFREDAIAGTIIARVPIASEYLFQPYLIPVVG